MKKLHSLLLLSMIFFLIIIMILFSEELHLKFHQEVYLSNNKLEKAIHPKRSKALLFIDSRYQPLGQPSNKKKENKDEPESLLRPIQKKEEEINAQPRQLNEFMIGDTSPELVYNK